MRQPGKKEETGRGGGGAAAGRGGRGRGGERESKQRGETVDKEPRKEAYAPAGKELSF